MTYTTINDAVTVGTGGGTVLGRIDKYELVRELGEGGFGAVYLAKDLGLAAEIRSSKGRLKVVIATGCYREGKSRQS